MSLRLPELELPHWPHWIISNANFTQKHQECFLIKLPLRKEFALIIVLVITGEESFPYIELIAKLFMMITSHSLFG